MAFPSDMTEPERRRLSLLAFLIVLGVAAVAAVLAVIVLDDSEGATAQTVREYNLEIVQTDIDYGGGNVWHAWTYKLAGAPAGSVPGPTLTATVGERLVVRVTNRLEHPHSFHTHLSHYPIEMDGSQINIISGIAPGAMIPPGGSYTYEFDLTEPGLYYYHDHSAEGTGSISGNIAQGLYGAIIVKAPDDPPVRDEVIFMSEIGSETEGDNIPVYIMNGRGIPGGEHALEELYHEQGFDAVAAQLGKTVPVISAKAGEVLRVHVINIGDQIHSFHAHSVSHISAGELQGRRWTANTLPLAPGSADTLQFTFTNPGLWLFHCHVVSHADNGMIGVFNIEQPPE
jgi:FtsP/CotA-like multicopper oxidase with cupredoxin domain